MLFILVLPSIINVSETALRAVPREYEEASLALGATATETYFRVSLHAARSGIAAAVVLGVGMSVFLFMVLPTFIVLFMLSVSNIQNNGMDQYMVFQNSMNKNTNEVMDLYVYNITIASKGTALYSFATAIGILKTLVSVTLLISASFLSKKLRGESIE